MRWPVALVANTTVLRSAGKTQWASGVASRSGADKLKIIAVTSSSTSASTGREVVQ